MASLGESKLSSQILGIKPGIRDLVVGLTGASETSPINIAAFVAFMINVEMLGRWPQVQPLTIFHDEIFEFEEVYNDLLKSFRDADPFDMKYPGGGIYTEGFESLSGFQALPSKENLFIQAADVLAGTLGLYARNVLDGVRPPEAIIEPVRITLAAALVDAPKLCTLIGSPRFYQKLFQYLR